MLLGYLDIYSQAIKDRDQIGEAFLPGDCFWDPLAILQGAPASMKRNMQERELFNGRVAMLAVAAFFFEEATTHLTLVDIEGNELLLTPAYTIPYIQEWLDQRFSPSFESMSDAPAMMASATTALTDAATAMMTMVATMIAMPPC
uniref:Uncharacterized protein n=1 Tax=Craspedostauros australis TaxID=1486917 RepID=A0A7S0F542_9STRA|mmetsp:Transcript_65/g.171  ORF Transcript_65/g.171 Transcript_65/m.171 type:complete len:145 (+) Transcript_65:2-436(+)